MLKKILAPLCLIALAGCDSGTGTGAIIQTDQSELVDAIPGPAATARLVTLPGRIEAEDFISQDGIRLGDTNDSGNSQFVGHIENNDYVEYDIDAPASGTYDLLARVGSLRNNATVNVIADGQNAGSFNVSPTGGWEVWETVSSTVNLSEGRQTLRLQFSGNANGLMNINWFSLAPSDDDTTTPPPPPPPPTGTDIELGSDRWTVTANQNSDDAFLAIDNNDSTRWTTSQVQQSGQQFTIDFNSTQTFDRLVLDSSDSNGDYPRDYEVEVSNNGSQWSTVAAGTGTSNGITVIDFADQNASHLRVNQLGSANRNWWSIHELALFANSSDTLPEPIPPVEEPVEPIEPVEPVDGIVDVFFVTGQSNVRTDWYNGIHERLDELSSQELVLSMNRHPGNALDRWWTNDDQGNYREDLDILQNTFDDIRRQNKEPRLRGFFWFQGETDTNFDANMDTYAARFMEYTSSFFGEFGVSNATVPVGIAVIDSEPTDAGNERMRSILFELGNDMNGFAFDTRGFDRSDNVHLTGSAGAALGEAMGDQFYRDFLRN